MSTLAAVLAAGAGRRFGGDKLRAPFRGRPLLTWALDDARAADLDGLVVVTGADVLADVVPPGVRTITNDRWAEGQATSLQVAVAAARAGGHDALVVGLADTPLVGAAAWRAVAATVTTPIAVADFGGRRRPPVRLHRDVWDQLPTGGDEGARTLLVGHPELVTAVPCPGDPADVDTRGDLARWS